MGAGVWPVGRVTSCVQAMLRGGGEAARAPGALVRLLPGVDALVLQQVALLAEALATHLARERLHAYETSHTQHAIWIPI